MKTRISDALRDKVQDYINTHEVELDEINQQKTATFQLIKKQIDANTLTADKLIDILSGLDSRQSTNLFAAGIAGVASTDSNAAKLIKELFIALGRRLSLANLNWKRLFTIGKGVYRASKMLLVIT